MNNNKELNQIVANFKQRKADVHQLLNIDNLLLDLAINELEDRQDSLKKLNIDNAYMLGENSLKNLRNIRNNNSLKPSYELVVNQSVVLMVSYFSSSMHDFFKVAYPFRIDHELGKKTQAKFIKLTLKELQDYNYDLTQDIGEIIYNQFSINFQDMKTISDSLREYLGIQMKWDKRVNNIITLQACRNAIAHAGEIADGKLINQLRNSQDRDIQLELKQGEKIRFTPEEVKIGSNSMLSYLEEAVSLV